LKKIYLCILGVILLTSCSNTPAQSTLVNYAIINVSIVDVENGNIIPRQTVIITGDRVVRIGDQGKVTIPKVAQIIDGIGLYLMPGLVDAHVHFIDPEVFGRMMIANGVLLVRDMGMPMDEVLNIQKALNQGDILGPEMIVTGAILDGDPPLIPVVSEGVKTPEEARAAVRMHADAGVDQIKVYATLTKDEFLAIINEANKYGLKVVGHVPDSIYIEDAARAGLKSSEHFFGFEKVIAKLLGEPVNLTYKGMGSEAGNFLKLDQVDPLALQAEFQKLKSDGLTVCPTIITFKVSTKIKTFMTGNFLMSEFISQTVFDNWKNLWSGQSELPDFIWQNWAKMVYGLYKSGVPLMTGTDLSTPGIIPGYSLHDEMSTWQDAGIPAAAVLRSATLIPAQFMGFGDRLGSVSEGKTASLVLVRANPLEDIRNAQQIEAVFLKGQYFDRQAINQLIQEGKDLARR
jgi:imidazolonepropionase-like amidohydrolase